MNSTFYNYILLIVLFFLFRYIGYFIINRSSNDTEPFTPYMRSCYRPHVRQMRIISEGFYNKHQNNITNLFRKFGIM